MDVCSLGLYFEFFCLVGVGFYFYCFYCFFNYFSRWKISFSNFFFRRSYSFTTDLPCWFITNFIIQNLYIYQTRLKIAFSWSNSLHCFLYIYNSNSKVSSLNSTTFTFTFSFSKSSSPWRFSFTRSSEDIFCYYCLNLSFKELHSLESSLNFPSKSYKEPVKDTILSYWFSFFCF